MSYFENLKKTLKHVNSEVLELKKIDSALLFKDSELCDPCPGIPPLDDEEIKKRIVEVKKVLKQTKNSALHLKSEVQHRVKKFDKFRYDVEEIFLEVYSSSNAVEKKLVSFGYCPPNLKPRNADEFSSKEQTHHQNEGEQDAKSVTPKLNIQKHSLDSPDKVKDCIIEKKEETPVMNSPDKVKDCIIEKKEETPVLNSELLTKDYKAIIESRERAQVPVLRPSGFRSSSRTSRKKRRSRKKTARKLDF